MKRFLMFCVIGWACVPVLTASLNADLFSYDTEKIRIEMEPLDQLEQLVSEREKVFCPEYFAAKSELTFTTGSILASDPTVVGFFSETPQNIPPFVWGCLLSGFGVALVYNASHDNEDTRKAFMGCIVNGIVLTSIYIINLLASY